MTNRSDRGSNKPRGAERFERDDVIRDPIRGLHQGQQPCGAARTGRTHGCTRPVLIAARKLLHRRGRPHMAQRPHHCTATLVQGSSTPSRHLVATSAGAHVTSSRQAPELSEPLTSASGDSFKTHTASVDCSERIAPSPGRRTPSPRARAGRQYSRCCFRLRRNASSSDAQPAAMRRGSTPALIC